MQDTALHARDWDEMADVDPLWAILSSPDKRFRQWDLQEFFHTGEDEIATLLENAQALGLPVKREVAVDFGCGVGRLTRALHKYFPQAHGVDISPRMLSLAREYNPTCDFREGSNLSSFPDRHADLVFSSLVLQHQPDQDGVMSVIQDMVRILVPGGLLVFQLPLTMPWKNRLQPRRRAYRLLRAVGIPHTFLYEKLKLSPIRMIWMPQSKVESIVSQAGGKVLKVERSKEHFKQAMSGVYYCTRSS